MNLPKPKTVREHLGADVSIEVKKLDKNLEMNAVLHRIGEDLAKVQPGMQYCGTIALHIYKETNHLAKSTYSLSNVTNIAMKVDISENAMLTLWQNAAIRIRSYFNPAFTHKTNDRKDQRGVVK